MILKDYRIFTSPIKRLFAFIIDLIILALFGYLSSLLLEKFYLSVGQLGKVIGFILSGLYFTILESRFNGQTIGKKIVNIKVIGINGNELTSFQYFLRYSIWGLCYFSNGLNFAGSRYETLLTSIGTIFLFGIGFVLLFLFVFNKKTKQSIHDIILGTYVINCKYDNPIEKQQINKVLLPVSIGIPIVAFILLFFINTNSVNTEISKLENYRATIVEMPEINNAGVSSGKTNFKSTNGNSNTSYYLQISTVLEDDYKSKSDIAIKVADLIISEYPEELSKDYISISVTYGYDIGIWSTSNSFSMKMPPGSWTNKITDSKNENDI